MGFVLWSHICLDFLFDIKSKLEVHACSFIVRCFIPAIYRQLQGNLHICYTVSYDLSDSQKLYFYVLKSLISMMVT